MERRKFLQYIASSLVLGASSVEGAVKETKFNAKSRKIFIDNMRISVTSAYWNDSQEVAQKFKDRYDSVWIPGISIKEDGTLKESIRTKKALVDGKRNLYIIQNHPEGDTWRPERASALLRLDDEKLRHEFARFKEGVNLDLESMTKEDNKNYPIFLNRLRKVYGGPLIVSTHAKIRLEEGVSGLGKEMDYKAIVDAADAMDYMTLDYWPGNPKMPIGSLDNFRGWLDCLFEQKEIDRNKIIVSIPTYVKMSYLKNDGEINEKREPLQMEEKKAFQDLEGFRIKNNKEGEFEGLYKREKIKGWMMTEEAFKARLDLLGEYGLNKIAFWYGDQFVARTPKLREMVYSRK